MASVVSGWSLLIYIQVRRFGVTDLLIPRLMHGPKDGDFSISSGSVIHNARNLKLWNLNSRDVSY